MRVYFAEWLEANLKILAVETHGTLSAPPTPETFNNINRAMLTINNICFFTLHSVL